MKKSKWLPLLIGAASLAGAAPARSAEPPAKPAATPQAAASPVAARGKSATPTPATATPAPVTATPVPVAPLPKGGAALPPAEDLKAAGLALKSAQAGRLEEALKQSEVLHKRLGNSSFYYELQGTILTLGKQYDRAEASFQEWLKLEPDSHIARFNRAETIMLQRRFAEAEAEFGRVEEDRRRAGDSTVADLARFKRSACCVAQNQLDAAERLAAPAVEGPQTAANAYARAMLSWAHQDIPSAIKLLDEARIVFPPETDSLYTDSFVELGWGRRDKAGKFVFSPKFR